MLKIRVVKAMLRVTAAAAISLLVAFSASAQTIRYVHTDGLGSVVLTTDKDRNIVERNEYEPYGTLLNRPITDGPGYTGHVMDAATNLTYMQQRYYDQSIGRFLSIDPVKATGVRSDFNRYWYASANPYKLTDPDGRLAAVPDSIGGSIRDDGRRCDFFCKHAFSESSWNSVTPIPSNDYSGPYKDGYVMPYSIPAADKAMDRGVGEFKFTSIFDKREIEASGIAAMGIGGTATKGLLNSNDKLGVCLMCIGASASADVTIATLSYTYPNMKSSPDSIGFGIGADVHGIWGVGIDIGGGDSGGSISLKTGPGLGASFKGVNLETTVDE